MLMQQDYEKKLDSMQREITELKMTIEATQQENSTKMEKLRYYS